MGEAYIDGVISGFFLGLVVTTLLFLLVEVLA